MKERLLCAFYHKGRKQFVPWTMAELCNRIKRAPDDVATELRGLNQTGLAVVKAEGWQLTQAGMIEARAIMAAQEMARSS